MRQGKHFARERDFTWRKMHPKQPASLSQVKTSADINAHEQKRCIMLQAVLKSKVWHDNKPKSQLRGPAAGAQAVTRDFICSHFLAKCSRFDFAAVATIFPLD
jgi:hypothetical protein